MNTVDSHVLGEERGEGRSAPAFDGGMLQWQGRLSCRQHQWQQVLQFLQCA